ncbi:MAG: DUF6152 family protein [Steroidobacteraceae bacterium]
MWFRNMKVRLLFCTTVCMYMFASQAVAHHSFAAFDRETKLTVEGSVIEVQWANPHVWVQVNVLNKSGELEDYAFEGFGTNILMRKGWSRSSLKPGDKVTVEWSPFRDGTKGGMLIRVKRADGMVLESYTE